jgi:hypothetical protein
MELAIGRSKAHGNMKNEGQNPRCGGMKGTFASSGGSLKGLEGSLQEET